MGGVSQYIPQWLRHHSTTIITKIFRVCAGLPKSPMVSADLTWSPLVSRALCWSQWSPWAPVVYLGLQWSLLVCMGLTWSPGSLLVSLVSRVLCWYSNTFWIFGWLFGMAWWYLRLWSCPGSLAFPAPFSQQDWQCRSHVLLWSWDRLSLPWCVQCTR